MCLIFSYYLTRVLALVIALLLSLPCSCHCLALVIALLLSLPCSCHCLALVIALLAYTWYVLVSVGYFRALRPGLGR